MVWLVADFEAIPYQGKIHLTKSESLETSTATAINYTMLQAGVFVIRVLNPLPI
jgi:hypothetical protein